MVWSVNLVLCELNLILFAPLRPVYATVQCRFIMKHVACREREKKTPPSLTDNCPHLRPPTVHNAVCCAGMVHCADERRSRRRKEREVQSVTSGCSTIAARLWLGHICFKLQVAWFGFRCKLGKSSQGMVYEGPPR